MLQRLAYRLQAFMYGRNGVDQLGWALLILGVVLNLIGNFTGLSLLCLLAYVPMGYALFRMFSKNLPQRQKENAWLLRLLHRENAGYGNYSVYQSGSYQSRCQASNRARAPFSGTLRQLRDREHKYFRCPKCRQTVRVPKGRGTLRITCPKCGERFEKKT